MFGRLASLPLFRVLRVPVFTAYGRFTGVNFEEVAKPLASYESLNNFFTRSVLSSLLSSLLIECSLGLSKQAFVPSLVSPVLSRAVPCCAVLSCPVRAMSCCHVRCAVMCGALSTGVLSASVLSASVLQSRPLSVLWMPGSPANLMLMPTLCASSHSARMRRSSW